MQIRLPKRYLRGFVNYFPRAIAGMLGVGLAFIGGIYYSHSFLNVSTGSPANTNLTTPNSSPSPQTFSATPSPSAPSSNSSSGTSSSMSQLLTQDDFVSGQASAVNGQNFTITASDGSQLTVDTSSSTQFMPGSISQVSTGDSVRVFGTVESSGDLQALSVVDITSLFGSITNQNGPSAQNSAPSSSPPSTSTPSLYD